jgi:hypothetical protein
MSNLGNKIFDILAEDEKPILYRKSLRAIAGSVTATILLHQMIFRFKGRDQFYKFKEPCGHKLYKPGDSWTEELGFSVKEFDNALKKIGTKVTQGIKRPDVLAKTDATGIILYWIDRERVTHYELNRPLLKKLLAYTYLNDQRADSNVTKGEIDKNLTEGYLDSFTETTTETTTDIQSPNGEIPENADPKTNGSSKLTDSQKDQLLLFGKHPDTETYNEQFDTIQEIQKTGWEITVIYRIIELMTCGLCTKKLLKNIRMKILASVAPDR